jgi:exopolysaccharide biosynthesis polyprenyl glycosylphosphotransferase
MSEQTAGSDTPDLHALLLTPPQAAAWHAPGPMASMVRLWLAIADVVLMIAVPCLGRLAWPGTDVGVGPAEAAGFGIIVALLATIMRYALYKAGRTGNREFAGVGRAVAAVGLAVGATGAACWLALSGQGAATQELPAWLTLWLVTSMTATAALRTGAARLGRTLIDGQRIVVVGSPARATPLALAIEESPKGAWRMTACVDPATASGLDYLMAIIEQHAADIVVLDVGGVEEAQTMAICAQIADRPVRVCLAVDAAPLLHVPRTANRIGHFALIDILTDPLGELGGAAKRAVDILGSLLLLAIFAPFMLLVALAVRLESSGPVLFRQWRFGIGSKPIQVLKFRTMRTDSCDVTGEQRTAARDPRVTPLGRLLRRSSVDELPQLLNVLSGDMSLIGPRPHPLHMRVGKVYYFDAVEHYRARHLVKPGITGWAQVNGSRGEVDTLEKARRRVKLDLWYLDHWSLVLDLRIILRTALGGFISPRAD